MWAYLFIVGQGFFLSLLLFTRKGTAQRIFSAFIFVFTYEIFIQYLLRSYGRNCFPVIFHLRDALMFLYGPLIYLYFSVSVGAIKELRPAHLMHLIPAVFFSYLKFLALNGQLAMFDPILSPDEAAGILSFNGIYHIMVFSFAALYLAQSIRLLRGYLLRMENVSDPETDIRRRWLSTLAGYSTITIVLFGVGLVCYLGILPFASAAFHTLSMWFSVSIVFSGYMVIRHIDVYHIMHGTNEVKDAEPGLIECSGEKYAKTRLSDETRDAYLETINDLLDREQLYLDPEITLSAFSDRVGIPAHHVSQVINVKMSHNFFSLMNSRRVEYAKDLLLSESAEFAPKTVLDIAYESGFNSKTTFNTVFKELTGCTPSEYKRKMRRTAPVSGGKCLMGSMQTM